jgi:NIPSNAP
MIVEVRSYRIKPGKREEFIKLFETRAVPAQRTFGMKVTGPFLDVENPNKFVFLRSFPPSKTASECATRFMEATYGRTSWKHWRCRYWRVTT